MNFGISFAPLIPAEYVWAAAAVAAAIALLMLVSRSRGALLRTAALALLVLALANPSLTREDRDPLSSVAVVVVDKSPSQNFGDRAAQTEAARAARDPALAAHSRHRDAGRRGRPGRRRDRRHPPVLGAQRDARRRPAGPRRGRDLHHRRPGARRAGRHRRARIRGARSRADQRRPQRTRPPRGHRRGAALRHRRPVAADLVSGRGRRRPPQRPPRSRSAATASRSTAAPSRPASR